MALRAKLGGGFSPEVCVQLFPSPLAGALLFAVTMLIFSLCGLARAAFWEGLRALFCVLWALVQVRWPWTLHTRSD